MRGPEEETADAVEQTKAGLVVAYYMHLRLEKIPLRLIALAPLLLVLILAVTLLLEQNLPR